MTAKYTGILNMPDHKHTSPFQNAPGQKLPLYSMTILPLHANTNSSTMLKIKMTSFETVFQDLYMVVLF